MPLQAPIMLALCSMLSRTYYAGNYARIIAASLIRGCDHTCTKSLENEAGCSLPPPGG